MMNTAPGRVSSSASGGGHLDPCAQEFTPGPYSLLRAAPHPPPPPPPPPPPLYYSYSLDASPYVQPTAAAGSIPVNPVLPMYNTASEMGISYVPTIPQQWDSRQQQQQDQEAFRLGMQGGEVAPPRCFPFPFLPRGGTRPYRYNNNNFNSGSNNNNNALASRTCNAMGSSTVQQHYQSPQQQNNPPFSLAREHASRTLLLSSVPTELSEADLRQQLERWGPVRALQTEKRHQGFVTVHYYDLRHAKTALTEIQEQHLAEQKRLQQHYNGLLFRQSPPKEEEDEDEEGEGEGEGNASGGTNEGNENGGDRIPPPPPPPPPELSRGLIGGKAIWAQYTIPVGLLPLGPDSHNQGTLVVFNLDADIDTGTLRSIFEAFGAVKELRETPTKRQHKFVEFFDVRDAARALAEMDGQEIGGKRVKIEFSRPGGQTRRRSPPPLHPPLQPLMHASPPPRCSNTSQLPMFAHQAQYQHQHHHPRHQLPYPRWSSAGDQDATWVSRTNADRAAIGHTSAINGRVGGRGRGGGPGIGCGSGAACGRGSAHSKNIIINSSNCDGRVRAGMEGIGVSGGSSVRRRRGNGTQQQSRAELASAEANCVVAAAAASKGSAKNGIISNNHNHNNARLHSETASHFAFDEAKAESNSSDARTTVMIKNIPNKYSQQMLLSMLDQHCSSCNGCNERITDPDEPLSAYDFVYLPIDFKNKCNLGYAFVNMTTSKATWKLYKAFHMQPWEAFNSRKICEVTYARIQGFDALKEHFRNSKFACDTDEYLPSVFFPPRDGGVHLTTPAPIGGHISSHKNTSNNIIATHLEDDQDFKAQPVTTSPKPYTNVKPYAATANVYHRSYGGHDRHTFTHGRRLQRSIGAGGGGGDSTNRVGCA